MELVRRHLVSSRTAARAAIDAGLVEVGGLPAPKAATLVDPDESVRIVGGGLPFVGRGGVKLAAALDVFPVAVEGRTALDVGASTGGFTDCLLERGARSVVTVDVGYGQLAWSLRKDPRVRVVERTNFRHVDPAALGAPFDVVVADLSFISLAKIAAQLRAAGHQDTDYLLLVKPQFELEKGQVGRGGIVREEDLHVEAVERCALGLDEAGIGLLRVMASPIAGAKGNREFLVWGRPGPRRLARAEIDEVVRR